VNQAQSLVQAQSRGTQGRPPVVGQRATHRQTIPAHHLGLAIGASLHRTLDRAHSPHALLEFLLRVAVRLEERARGLAQVVELAELVRHVGQHGGDRVADGVLPVRDDAGHRHGQRGDGFPEQRRQVVAGPAQQTPRQEDLAREAVAQDPEHFMPDIWLQPIERQDHAPLRPQSLLHAIAVGEMDSEQFFIAVQQVRARALSDPHAAAHQMPVDLRDAAVRRVTQPPDQRDHIEAEGAPRERPPTLLFGAIRPMIQGARRILTAPDRQRQPYHLGERADRTLLVVRHP